MYNRIEEKPPVPEPDNPFVAYDSVVIWCKSEKESKSLLKALDAYGYFYTIYAEEEIPLTGLLDKRRKERPLVPENTDELFWRISWQRGIAVCDNRRYWEDNGHKIVLFQELRQKGIVK